MLRLSAQSVCSRAACQPAGRRHAVVVRAAEAKAAPKKTTVPEKAAPVNDHKIGKTQLKEAVAAATKLSQADASRAVDALLTLIMDSVAAGKEVSIPGFGAFTARTRKARKGRNPQTGAPLEIAEKTAPGFSAGKTFKDHVAAYKGKK